MRRILAIAAGIALVAGLYLALTSRGADPYLVRAVFDNGSFVVPDEDVRVAGANVGSVESVDVTLPGETASEDGGVVEGKGVVVLRIDDPAFQDFRADASCQIRPQSLIGERYIDCRPTLPRAPGSPAPPPLGEVPEGDPGEGQLLLPLESNGKTVDLDLINNVMRRPYAERFRIVLSDLGAGFAARGEDIAEIVRRANPTLRDVNRFLKVLADQNRSLARLTAESDQILGPLARERAHVAGFVDNAGATAEAAAERGDELEANLLKLPGFLRELRATMRQIGAFSDQALPVVEDFGRSAPQLTAATRRLTPFASASIRGLRSLGDAAVEAGPKLRAITPVVRRTRRLARTGARPLTKSSRFLRSLRRSRGLDHLMDLIYNTAGSVNGFDAFGHYLRSRVVPVDCFEYWARREFRSNCPGNFLGGLDFAAAATTPSPADAVPRLVRRTSPRAANRGSEALLDFLFAP